MAKFQTLRVASRKLNRASAVSMRVCVAFAVLMAAKPAIGADVSALDNGSSAFAGGGQLGATYRAGNFVLGVEWMLGGTLLNASLPSRCSKSQLGHGGGGSFPGLH